jgi:hypothetical protein
MPPPFRFPRNPGTRRPDPFVDEQGKNPFADPHENDVPDADGQPSLEERASPFTAPAGRSSRDTVREYQVSGYETTLPHRGRTLLTIGVTGLFGAILGALGGMASVLAGYGFSQVVFLSGLAPLSFLSLAASIPCWMMAGYDLRAIRAGAMDAAGERVTRLAWFLGVGATLLSLALISVVLVAIVAAIRDALSGL